MLIFCTQRENKVLSYVFILRMLKFCGVYYYNMFNNNKKEKSIRIILP